MNQQQKGRGSGGRGGGGGSGRGRTNNSRGHHHNEKDLTTAPSAAGGTNKNIGKNNNPQGAKKSDAVNEDRRIFFQQQLLAFRESNELEMSFPSTLNSTERKFIHRIVTELGLTSKSSGVGENRFITVRKREATVEVIESNNNAIPWDPSAPAAQLLQSKDFQQAIEELQILHDARVIAEEQRKNISNKAPFAHRLNAETIEKLKAAHKVAESKRTHHADFEELQKKRKALPASHYRYAVTKIVADNQISLVSGETGCGKSTQVPQYLLEDPLVGPVSRIVVTQPRRISAVALAERISFERSEQVGSTVGYNIRLESKQCSTTQVLFVTPGVLLRKLIEDPNLEEFSHVIVDEAHERDRYTEFLLILLRDICERRRSLKLVLMSATMHTHKLKAYFGDIPQINVGGSVFPVQEYYLEHVLKFTNYSPPAVNAANASSDFLKWQSGLSCYHCSICAKGPFLSAEELGTHAALCFPDSLANKHHHHQQQNKSTRQNKLQELSERLKYIKYKVSLENPQTSLPGSSASPNAPETITDYIDADIPALEENSFSDSDPDISDDEEEDGVANQLVDKNELGKEKQLLSEESTEFNAILKLYQENQTESNNGDDNSVDFDLIVSLLKFVFQSEFGADGSVLIFLPGWDDISKLQRLLQSTIEFNDSRKFLILQLHSGIPRKEQNLVFQTMRNGQRKIILSTNIAETSLTIDDVTVVIDSGKMKEKVYDPHTKLSFLKTSYISQASGRQRKGRAGRTRAGVCFHLYSVLRGKHLPEFQESELLRMPLEELVIQAKSIGVAPGKGDEDNSVKSFLLKAMDPPHDLSIQHAIGLLQSLHCMDANEELTDLGTAVSKLPMNPRLGKMLIFGCLMGCGPGANNIAAVMSYRDPFILSTSDVQRNRTQHLKLTFSQHSNSDQVAVYRALDSFSSNLKRFGLSEAKTFCEKNDLSLSTMLYLDDVSQQLNRQLMEIGIYCYQAKALRNNGNLSLVASLLTSGLYPGFAMRKSGASLFSTERGPKAKIHPSSVNSKAPYYRGECKKSIDIIGFQELIALNPHKKNASFGGPNYLMLGTSSMNVLTLLICCGDLEVISNEKDEEDETTSADCVVVRVDGWFKLKLAQQSYENIRKARELINLALVQYVNDTQVTQTGTIGHALDSLFLAIAEEQGQLNKLASGFSSA